MTSTSPPRRPTVHRRRAWIVAAAVAVGMLGACGSDEATSRSAPQTDTEVSVSNADVTRLWILPEVVECEGSGPQTCLQVATSAVGPYELFYDSIDGYEHLQGTAAVIDVTIDEVEDPPADGSSLTYMLVAVVEVVE